MKKNGQHDLEELLKDNLSDKTANVPDFVWDNIEEELFPEKKRRGFFWLFFFGIGVIAAVSAFYLFSGKDKQVEDQLANNQAHRKVLMQQTERQNESHKYLSKSSGNKNSHSKSVSENNAQSTPGRETKPLAISNGHPAGKSFKRSVEKNRGKSGKPFKNPSDPNGHASGSLGNPAGNSTTNDPKTQLTEKQPEENAGTGAEETKNQPADSSVVADIPDSSKAPTSHNGDPAKPDDKKAARFAISVYGGTNLYEVSVFKDYFTSGQLSNRPFRAGGFEAGAGFSYSITPKLGIYTQLAFNRKAASFNYNLAITEADYFNHYKAGELIPLENIEDGGANSCFLVRDVIADYRIDSWLFSLGTTFQLLQRNKITLGTDLRFSGNLNSKMHLDKLTVIQVQSFANERFNYFKLGAGLNIDYRINPKITIGISPIYHWQFNSDKQSFYKGKMQELVVPVKVGFWF